MLSASVPYDKQNTNISNSIALSYTSIMPNNSTNTIRLLEYILKTFENNVHKFTENCCF